MINEHGEIFRPAVAHRDPAKDRLAQELIGREVLAPDAPAGAPAAMQALSTQFIEDFSDDLLAQSLLYTDGLTDAAAPPALTQAQLGERVRNCSPDDLDGLLAQLESDAVGEAGGHPHDDIALLAVRPGEDPHRSNG